MEVKELEGLRPRTFWSMRPVDDWKHERELPVYFVQYQLTSTFLDTFFIPTPQPTTVAVSAFEEYSWRSSLSFSLCKVLGSAMCKNATQSWCSVVVAKPNGTRLDQLQAEIAAGARPRLTEQQLLTIVAQVVEVLEQLHTHGLVHAGIQLSSCYVDVNWRTAVLDDYAVGNDSAKPPGAASQRSPENDIWSIGTLMLALFTSHESMLDLMDVYANGSSSITLPSELMSKSTQDIIQRCLQRDPQARPSAAQLGVDVRQLLSMLAAGPAVPANAESAVAAAPEATDEFTLHCQLLKLGSKVSKSFSLLVMSELMLNPSKRDEVKGCYGDQAVIATALGDAFQDTKDNGVDYMPLESQSLLSRAALAMLADERFTGFHKVMLEQNARRLHAYLFVQGNVVQSGAQHGSHSAQLTQGMATLIKRDDGGMYANAIVQYAPLVETLAVEAAQAQQGRVNGLVALTSLVSACAPTFVPNLRDTVLRLKIPGQLPLFLSTSASPDVQVAGFLLWLSYPRLQLDPVQAVIGNAQMLQVIVDVAAQTVEGQLDQSAPALSLSQILEAMKMLREKLPAPSGPAPPYAGTLSNVTKAIAQTMLRTEGGHNLLMSLISSSNAAAMAIAVDFCTLLLSAITSYVGANSSNQVERASLLVQLGVSPQLLQGLLAATLSQLPPQPADMMQGPSLVALVVHLVHCLPFVADALLKSVTTTLLETFHVMAMHAPHLTAPLLGSVLRLIQEATPFRAGTAASLPTRIADALIANQFLAEMLGLMPRMERPQLLVAFAVLHAVYTSGADFLHALALGDAVLRLLVDTAHAELMAGARPSTASKLLSHLATTQPQLQQRLHELELMPKASQVLSFSAPRPDASFAEPKPWELNGIPPPAGGMPSGPPAQRHGSFPTPLEMQGAVSMNGGSTNGGSMQGGSSYCSSMHAAAPPNGMYQPRAAPEAQMDAIMHDLGLMNCGQEPPNFTTSQTFPPHYANGLPPAMPPPYSNGMPHSMPMSMPPGMPYAPAVGNQNASGLMNGAAPMGPGFMHANGAYPGNGVPQVPPGWGIAAPAAAPYDAASRQNPAPAEPPQYMQPQQRPAVPVTPAAATQALPKKFNVQILPPPDQIALTETASTPSSMSDCAPGVPMPLPPDIRSAIKQLEDCMHEGAFVTYFLNEGDLLQRVVTEIDGIAVSSASCDPADAATIKSAGVVLRRLAKRSLTRAPKSVSTHDAVTTLMQMFTAEPVLDFLLRGISQDGTPNELRADLLQVLSALTFGSQVDKSRFSAAKRLVQLVHGRGGLRVLVEMLLHEHAGVRMHALEPLRNICYFSTKHAAEAAQLIGVAHWQSALRLAVEGGPGERNKLINLVYLLVSKHDAHDGTTFTPPFINKVMQDLIQADFARQCCATRFVVDDGKDDLLKRWSNLLRSTCEASPEFAQHVAESGAALSMFMAIWPLLAFAAPRQIRDFLRERRPIQVLPDEHKQAACEQLALAVQAVLSHCPPSLADRDTLLALCQGSLADKSKAAQLMALHGTSWSVFAEPSRSKKADPHAKVAVIVAALGAILKEAKDELAMLAALLCFYEWCMPGAEGGALPAAMRQTLPVPFVVRTLKDARFPTAQYLATWTLGIMVYNEGDLQLRLTKSGFVDILIAWLNPRSGRSCDMVQAATLALGNMLFNNHACIKNPNLMDEPIRGIVTTLERCPKPGFAAAGRPRLDCAKHIAEGLVNITYRHQKNCQKLREANGISCLLRVIQGVVEECNRSPLSYEPSRTGIEKCLRVLKYMLLNDSKTGETRRILLGMPALHEVLEFFTRYGDEVGREARSVLAELFEK